MAIVAPQIAFSRGFQPSSIRKSRKVQEGAKGQGNPDEDERVERLQELSDVHHSAKVVQHCSHPRSSRMTHTNRLKTRLSTKHVTSGN